MIQYISIRQVLDDLLSHPLLLDLTLERAVNYALEFIRIVGMPLIFTDKIATVEVKDYRGQLPCDFTEMIQVTDDKGHPFRYTTDTFHLDRKGRDVVDYTYKLLNTCIFTNIENVTLKISYRAIDVDSDGFPLLPDNSSFIKALELYIKKQWFMILFDLGKISAGVYLNTQLEYAWYVGLALSDLIRPTIDLMLSITAMWNLLVTKATEPLKLFVNTGTTEYIKTH